MVLSNLDRDLLRACLERQPGSWEGFVERFLGLIKSVARSSADSRGIALSDDDCNSLVIDVFQELINDDFAILRQFREQSSLGTFLVVVSRRIVVRRLMHFRPKPTSVTGAGKADGAGGLAQPVELVSNVAQASISARNSIPGNGQVKTESSAAQSTDVEQTNKSSVISE